jgi:molecular chaperone DnaK
VPYKLVKAANGDAHIQVEVDGKPKSFSPQEISAMILAQTQSRR